MLAPAYDLKPSFAPRLFMVNKRDLQETMQDMACYMPCSII